MKYLLALSGLLFFLSAPLAHAGESVPSYVDLTDGPTITVDWSKGNAQAVTLHGNRALLFTNGQKGAPYILIIKQDATGSRTVAWPSSVRWPGYTGRPMLTTIANKKDYLSFFYDGESYDVLGIVQNL